MCPGRLPSQGMCRAAEQSGAFAWVVYAGIAANFKAVSRAYWVMLLTPALCRSLHDLRSAWRGAGLKRFKAVQRHGARESTLDSGWGLASTVAPKPCCLSLWN